ncbi:MAG: hypothetical protein ACE5JN_13725, partial [Candidatus Methylomirabilia bacterium]
MRLVSAELSVSGSQDVLTLTLEIDPDVLLGPDSLTLVSALDATPLPFSLDVVLPPPRVDLLIPPLVSIGSLVQIEGAGFEDTAAQNQVTINGVALPVVSGRGDRLIAQVVAGAATGPVTVTTAQGSGVSPAPLTVIAATHPQQNQVTATLQGPFRGPFRIAVSPDETRA